MKLKQMYWLLFVLLMGSTAHADGPTDEVAVLTYLKLKPGTESRFKAALNKIVKPSLAEPGNNAWFVQQSHDNPSSIVFFTRWKNEDALQIHLKSKPVADYIAETAPLLELGYPRLVRLSPIDQVRNDTPPAHHDSNECDYCSEP